MSNDHLTFHPLYVTGNVIAEDRQKSDLSIALRTSTLYRKRNLSFDVLDRFPSRMSEHDTNNPYHMQEKLPYLERTKLKLESARNVQEKFEMKLCDKQFVIYPKVFHPKIFFGTEFLAKEIIKVVSEFHPRAPKILEIGTGAGYMSILSVLHGASHATATDINEMALENANENLDKFGMQDKITILHSDVFDGINSNETFDIIFWNHPFGHVNKSVNELEMLERAVLDPFYQSLDKYLKMAHEYLDKSGGRLFAGFSITAGDKMAFEAIAHDNGWMIDMRQETKSDTEPVMQIGFNELKRSQ